MNIYALDSEFNLITVAIPYDNLQWNRRYYDAGSFLMQIPEEVFDPNWAYIGTPDRPELGIVQKVATVSSGMLVGGFFCEAMLDDYVCYPRHIGDVQHTETAFRTIFQKYGSSLPITLAEPHDPLLGDRTQSDFSDNELGKKLFSILEPRELSYRVLYDYAENKLIINVWQGLDRTQSQDVNSRQVFSNEFGNLAGRTLNQDLSDYKNYAIIPCNADDNGKENNTYYVDLTNGEPRKEIVIDKRSLKPDEGQSMAEFKAAVEQEAIQELLKRSKIIEIDVTPLSGYMTDFDLGDKCDVVLTDLQIEMETRIVEVKEVVKPAGHTITVGLGNKRITRIRRLANS